jgi:hypothetical protein
MKYFLIFSLFERKRYRSMLSPPTSKKENRYFLYKLRRNLSKFFLVVSFINFFFIKLKNKIYLRS